MSHYTTIQTQFRELPILLSSLQQMGFQHVECHEQAQPLYGYQGDRRPETAEVIIRREHIGRAANDVGFKRQESGEFRATISEYDRRTRCNDQWLRELNRTYAYHLVRDQAREQDLVIEEEKTLENGDVVIVLSERG
ncbi:MAG: DUF1257 domain-containing protein [Polyangiaceae bacterium]|nr:DUF1257 domain-containing protein [Polyangiaceae bacterium]